MKKTLKFFPFAVNWRSSNCKKKENPMKLHSEASVWRQWKHWIWMRQDVNKITEHVMKFPFRLQIRKPLCHICWLLPLPPPPPPPQHTTDVTTVQLIRCLGFIRWMKHMYWIDQKNMIWRGCTYYSIQNWRAPIQNLSK